MVILERGGVARGCSSIGSLRGAVVVLAVLLAALVVTVPDADAAPAPLPTGLVSLQPARLMDTRADGTTIDARFAGDGLTPAGVARSLTVLGRGGVPTTDVAAVVVNITVDNSGRSGQGFVTVYPTGVSRPNASSVNYAPGAVVANEIVAQVGQGGTIELYTQASTHLVVDVVGWFPWASSSVFPLTPTRVMDTRADGTTFDAQYARSGAVRSGQAIDLQVAGRGAVPAGVAAVVMNVTVVNENRPGAGFVTISPTGAPRPLASSLNYAAGKVVANEVIAGVGANNRVSVYVSSETHVVIDVVGYFYATAAPGVVSANPARLMDTRPGETTIDGLFAAGGVRRGGTTIDLTVMGRANVPTRLVDSVVLNVTVVNPGTASGFVTVHPAGTGRPTASSVNHSVGQVVANEVIAKVGADGAVSVFVSSDAHVVIDVVGWFSAVEPPVPLTSVQAVYVLPSDGAPVAGRLPAIAHEAAVVTNWFDGQTGGEHPVFVKTGGQISVITITVPYTAAQIAVDPAAEFTLERAVRDQMSNGGRGTALAMIYEGSGGQGYCGAMFGSALIIPIDNCAIAPSASSVWPGGMSYLLGHELTHLLGAVEACAPHHNSGHVNDDPRDVIYQGPLPRDWNNLMLDPGRDDYFRHGRSDCGDIDASPLLGTA